MPGDRAVPNLPSRDFDATAQFYGGFGFTERYRADAWMILTRGPLELEFFLHPQVDPLSSGFQCTIRVADLDELWQEIQAIGVPVMDSGYPRLHEPRMQEWGLRAAFLVDVDGTQLTLIEEPR